jgi:protein-S-isoprenylcysteine O-methyltransferase Ste14
MTVRPLYLFGLVWIGWLISWLVAALWSSRAQKRVATWDTKIYRAAIALGSLLMLDWPTGMLAQQPLWHVGSGAYALLAVAVAGVSFAWWARLHLGRLWSGAITRKEGHRIVESGPYGLVRHPIYTGLITAVLATAAALATVTALAGAALVACGLWLKARAEERFLMAEFGVETYGDYCRRVPMLVPFLPRGRRARGA